MKAYQLTAQTGLNSLARVDVPEPRVAAGQVLVKIRATSLNYRDLMATDGRYPGVKLPLIPLSDGAGEIVALGDGVTRWRIGDRVAGAFSQSWLTGPFTQAAFESALGGGVPGVLAEYVALSEDGVVGIPAHLSFEEAATLPCAGVTAWHALVTRGQVAADETVLVLGTGGVSLFALQFAKLHGARVIVTSGSDEKLERARALGADLAINYRTTPEWETEVRRLTDGEGAHHVLEIGGHDTFPRSLRSAAVGGTISVIGGVGGGFMTELSLIDTLLRNITIRGLYVGSRGMFNAMNRAIAQNRLKPVIDRVFAFEDAPAAYAYLQSGAHFGKVVITV